MIFRTRSSGGTIKNLYFQLAGNRTAIRGPTVELETHHLHALVLLKEMPPSAERDRQELELLLTLDPALIAVRGYASAEVALTYSRAREPCSRKDDPEGLFSGLYGLRMVHLNRCEFGRGSRFGRASFLARGYRARSDTLALSALRPGKYCVFGQANFRTGK